MDSRIIRLIEDSYKEKDLIGNPDDGWIDTNGSKLVGSQIAEDIAIEYSLWLGALSRFWFYVYDVHTNKWKGISKTSAQGGEMEFTPEGLFDQFLKETYGDN